MIAQVGGELLFLARSLDFNRHGRYGGIVSQLASAEYVRLRSFQRVVYPSHTDTNADDGGLETKSDDPPSSDCKGTWLASSKVAVALAREGYYAVWGEHGGVLRHVHSDTGTLPITHHIPDEWGSPQGLAYLRQVLHVSPTTPLDRGAALETALAGKVVERSVEQSGRSAATSARAVMVESQLDPANPFSAWVGADGTVRVCRSDVSLPARTVAEFSVQDLVTCVPSAHAARLRNLRPSARVFAFVLPSAVCDVGGDMTAASTTRVNGCDSAVADSGLGASWVSSTPTAVSLPHTAPRHSGVGGNAVSGRWWDGWRTVGLHVSAVQPGGTIVRVRGVAGSMIGVAVTVAVCRA